MNPRASTRANCDADAARSFAPWQDDYEPDELGYQRHRAVDDAARHRASWSPEYRAKLYAEWNAPRDCRAIINGDGE